MLLQGDKEPTHQLISMHFKQATPGKAKGPKRHPALEKRFCPWNSLLRIGTFVTTLISFTLADLCQRDLKSLRIISWKGPSADSYVRTHTGRVCAPSSPEVPLSWTGRRVLPGLTSRWSPTGPGPSLHSGLRERARSGSSCWNTCLPGPQAPERQHSRQWWQLLVAGNQRRKTPKNVFCFFF